LIRTAVPPEKLSDLNSRLLSVKSVGQVVGLITSGLLLTVVGYSGLFLICGLTFLPLAWATARMPLTRTGSVAEPSQSSSLMTALREIWASKLMRSSFVLMGVLIFTAWPLMVLLPPVAGYMFPASQVALSFLMAIFFIGSALVSPMINMRISGLKGTRKALVSGERYSWPRRLLPLVSVAIALLALTAHVEPALLGLALSGLLLIPAGLLLGVIGVMTTSLVQREISPAAAAMGLTAYVIVVEIGTSIGSLIAAAIADSIGVFIVLIGLGALGIIATIWLISDRYFVSVSDMVAEAFVPAELMSKLPSKPAKA
jgi:MFS family permease